MLSIIEASDRPFSVVAKIEVKNIFFLKQIFTIMKAKFMDRDDVRQSLRVIQEVTEEVKSGRNFLIFPEGTRSKERNHPGEFKGGSFKCAIKARCPIVPVAMLDSYKAIRPVTVQVHFLKPLYYEDYKDMKSTEIAELVRNKIVKRVEEAEAVSEKYREI